MIFPLSWYCDNNNLVVFIAEIEYKTVMKDHDESSGLGKMKSHGVLLY
jgi:hypothetical protein